MLDVSFRPRIRTESIRGRERCEEYNWCMEGYGYWILATGWLLWLMPLLLAAKRRNRTPPAELDLRARWGLVLEGVAYSILWQSKFWERSPTGGRAAFSILFFLLASILSWTAAGALGRQWRIDAGLNSDHQLVTSGPYRVVRHPIYTSMLCVLLGTGFLITPAPLLALAAIVFIAGTEIRVRIEDKLLASRFAERFSEYQRSVPAYIPFLR